MFAAAFALAGCSRKLAPRYFGWLYLAGGNQRSLAVADLSEFRRVADLSLPSPAGQLLHTSGKLFVTCPGVHSLFEIDTTQQRVGGRISIPGRIVAFTSAGNGQLAVITEQPSALHLIDAKALRATRRVSLPQTPRCIDATATWAAIGSAAGGSVARVSLTDGKFQGETELGGSCSTLRICNNGEAIIAGAADIKQIITIDSGSGAVIARMPLAFAPARFCFGPDNGQMFVTGNGEDSIAIVSPFQSQIDQTIVAGRTPFGMAVASGARNLLLVTNPGAGDLTILDIETRHLAASVHVGGVPGEVILTPDQEYALVVSQDTGDVAVIRLSTALKKEGGGAALEQALRPKPLFTVLAMGANPRSMAIVPAG